jgi:hypothetical protein
MAGSRSAAIVLTRVHVFQAGRDRQQRGGDVFLFDVGVKGVEQDADVPVIDLDSESHGVGCRI